MSDSPGAGLPRAIDLAQRPDGGWVLRLECLLRLISDDDDVILSLAEAQYLGF